MRIGVGRTPWSAADAPVGLSRLQAKSGSRGPAQTRGLPHKFRGIHRLLGKGRGIGPGTPGPYVFAVASATARRTIFLGAFLGHRGVLEPARMYSSSTRRDLGSGGGLASTRFRFFAKYQNALSEVCSHNMQHITTIRSRAVMENRLRR